MKVTVLFFGITHDLTGFDHEQLEICSGESLAGLWRRYEARFPKLGPIADSIVLAVNQDIPERSTLLQDGDEVAVMPPVSGGAGGDFFHITRDPIPVADLSAKLRSPADGAGVVFEGIVRNNSRGRATLYLEYEGYEPMALAKMEEIGREAKGKFAIDSIGMVHRLGRMEIGETSVAIFVASAHRRAAFEACQYGIDRLKQIVPIWKKEYFADGAVWAEGEGQTRILIEPRG